PPYTTLFRCGGRYGHLLQAVREGSSLSDEQYAGTGYRTTAEPGRSREAGWSVRVHSVRLLLHQLPVLLVEPGQVPRSRRVAAGLSLPGRQPRHRNRGTSGGTGRSVQRVPLPWHHELRERLPEGSEPDQGNRPRA